MKTYDGRGNLINETNSVMTSDGKRVTTQTSYSNNKPTSQTITTSEPTGALKTERVLGGKRLP